MYPDKQALLDRREHLQKVQSILEDNGNQLAQSISLINVELKAIDYLLYLLENKATEEELHGANYNRSFVEKEKQSRK